MNGEEALRLSYRLEAAHLALSLPGRLMGDLRPVVDVLPSVMDDGGHGGPMSGAIASQLVGHQAVRLAALSLQQPAKEAFCSTVISASLNEDVDHVAVLADGSPEIMPLALNRHEELVQVPRVTQSPFSSFQCAGTSGAELPTPPTDGLVGDGDSPLRQQILDVSEAQAEPVIKPHSVADLRWVSVPTIAECAALHDPLWQPAAQVDSAPLMPPPTTTRSYCSPRSSAPPNVFRSGARA